MRHHRERGAIRQPLAVRSGRRQLLASLAALPVTLSLPRAAEAQTAEGGRYPNRVIRLIHPSAAGGPFDQLARLTIHPIEKRLGQPIVPDYRPGAGGSLGIVAGARAPADGYHLVVGALAQRVLNPILDSTLAYDADRDLEPIVLLAHLPYVLVVNPSVPVKTAPELIAYARANPGKLNYGSHGSGTASHVACELFKHAFGLDISHVPYKSSGQAVVDLIGGQIQMMFDGLQATTQYVQQGSLRAIAMPAPSRVPQMPNVPTFQEQGLPPLQAGSWFALFAPAGTPPAIIELLNAEVNRVMQLPETQQGINRIGMVAAGGSAQQLASFIEAEKARWRPVLQSSQTKSG